MGVSGRSWNAAFAVAGAYLAAIALAAARLPCPSVETHGVRLALCLLAVQAAAFAVALPFLAARSCALGGWLGRVAVVALPAAGMAVASLVIIWAAVRGAVGIWAIAWSQVFYLSFGALLAGVTVALWGLGVRPAAAQAAATALGLLMLGQVFFANTLVEAAESESGRMSVIRVVLWSNPWLIVGGSILQADPLRSEHLYDWSVIVYYGFRYPGAAIGSAWARGLYLSGVYAACAAVLAAIGAACGRLRRAGKVRGVDTACPVPGQPPDSSASTTP